MIITQHRDAKGSTLTCITDETFARWGINPFPWFEEKAKVGANNVAYWYKDLSEADKAELFRLDADRFRIYEGPELSFRQDEAIIKLSKNF